MERLLWFIFIRWSWNVAMGCVTSFMYAEPPACTVEKEDVGCVAHQHTQAVWSELCARGYVRLSVSWSEGWEMHTRALKTMPCKLCCAQTKHPCCWDLPSCCKPGVRSCVVHPQLWWSSAEMGDAGGSRSQPRLSAACFWSTFKHKAWITAIR